MSVEIPRSIEELTPEWLNSVLVPTFPGARVTATETLAVSTGSAARVRIGVAAEGNGKMPASFVIKAAFTDGLGDDELAKAWIPLMTMLHESETHWYTKEAAILGDRCPRCYHAAISGHDAVLLLEDLNNRDSIRFGAFDEPLNADDMASLLEVLAELHAARWNDPALVTTPMRDSFLAGGMLDGFLSEVNWDQQMSRPRAAGMPAELDNYQRCTTAIRAAWSAKRTGPQSLIHGDPHIGNYFFDATGAGLLDWQLFTSGHWASDVVYAVASAMETEARRSHERELLDHYLDRLGALTGAAPSREEAWRDYRKFAVWGVASILTPGEGVQSEDYLAVVGKRHAQAAVDLESLALLAAV